MRTVHSPSTSLKDRNLKYRLYEQEGVTYYCLIDPAENLANIQTEPWKVHQTTRCDQ